MKENIMSVPDGTRDLLYEDCKVIEKLTNEINLLFDNWNYKEVITPSLEYYDTFTNYRDGINQEDMYKFFDNKGRILSLKADCTIPIARVVSSKLKDKKLPLKLRYMSRVFRVNESFAGKRNEYIDCGIEYIGGEHFFSDVEVLVIGIEAIKKSNIENFKIELGHIGIIRRICELSNLDDHNKEYLVKLIEEKKLVELEQYLEELNISHEYKEIFKKIPWYFGGREVLKKGKELINDDVINRHIGYLDNIYKSLESMGYEKYLSFDLGMAPKIKYYSGIVFRGYVDGIGNYILYGGRYDNLIKAYGLDLKAVGLSLRVNELIDVIDKDKFIDKEVIEKIFYNEENFNEKIKVAKEKIIQGKKVELSKEAK